MFAVKILVLILSFNTALWATPNSSVHNPVRAQFVRSALFFFDPPTGSFSRLVAEHFEIELQQISEELSKPQLEALIPALQNTQFDEKPYGEAGGRTMRVGRSGKILLPSEMKWHPEGRITFIHELDHLIKAVGIGTRTFHWSRRFRDLFNFHTVRDFEVSALVREYRFRQALISDPRFNRAYSNFKAAVELGSALRTAPDRDPGVPIKLEVDGRLQIDPLPDILMQNSFDELFVEKMSEKEFIVSKLSWEYKGAIKAEYARKKVFWMRTAGKVGSLGAVGSCIAYLLGQ